MNKEVIITAVNERGWWAECISAPQKIIFLLANTLSSKHNTEKSESIYSAKGRPEEKSNIYLEPANRCETAANSWRGGSIGAHLCCKQIKQQMRLPTD